MMKFLITDFRKEYLYGDCYYENWGYYRPLIGVIIKVKILGLGWFNYKNFYYKNK